MMFKNLTGQPLKVLDIIPDLINHNPNQKVKEELDKKEINFKVRIFMIRVLSIQVIFAAHRILNKGVQDRVLSFTCVVQGFQDCRRVPLWL